MTLKRPYLPVKEICFKWLNSQPQAFKPPPLQQCSEVFSTNLSQTATPILAWWRKKPNQTNFVIPPGAVLQRKLPGANSRHPWELPQHTVTWWSSSTTAWMAHLAGQCHPLPWHHCSSSSQPNSHTSTSHWPHFPFEDDPWINTNKYCC